MTTKLTHPDLPASRDIEVDDDMVATYTSQGWTEKPRPAAKKTATEKAAPAKAAPKPPATS